MNAPLPEHIRRALESVTLDDNLRSKLRQRLTIARSACYAVATNSSLRSSDFVVEEV